VQKCAGVAQAPDISFLHKHFQITPAHPCTLGLGTFRHSSLAASRLAQTLLRCAPQGCFLADNCFQEGQDPHTSPVGAGLKRSEARRGAECLSGAAFHDAFAQYMRPGSLGVLVLGCRPVRPPR
jgi:hypothetical protein